MKKEKKPASQIVPMSGFPGSRENQCSMGVSGPDLLLKWYSIKYQQYHPITMGQKPLPEIAFSSRERAARSVLRKDAVGFHLPS